MRGFIRCTSIYIGGDSTKIYFKLLGIYLHIRHGVPDRHIWSIGWVSDHGSFICYYAGLRWYWENDTLEATGSPSQIPIVRIFEETYYMVIFRHLFSKHQNGNKFGKYERRVSFRAETIFELIIGCHKQLRYLQNRRR